MLKHSRTRKPKIPQERRGEARIKKMLDAIFDDPVSIQPKLVNNFSNGGFFINTKKKMQPGTRVQFRVVLPKEYKSKEIRVVGMVVFSLEESIAKETGTIPGIGVKILELPKEDDRVLFEQFLADQKIEPKESFKFEMINVAEPATFKKKTGRSVKR